MDAYRAGPQQALSIRAVSTKEARRDGLSAGPSSSGAERHVEASAPTGPTSTDASSGHGVETGFRGPQVCNIIGITYRQLDYWARTDLLRPSLTDARGSGSQRRYSYTDLLQLKVIKQLLDNGISLRSTRRAIECLRASGGEVASA